MEPGRGARSAPPARRPAIAARALSAVTALAALAALAWLLAPSPAAPPPDRPDAARLVADVEALAGFSTRFAASARRPEVLAWLRGRLAASGAAVREQRFPLRVGERETEQVNLWAILPGRDPGAPLLVLVAHWDSVNEGWEGETPSLVDPESPAPGAGDNASGVAVLLESLRLLAARPPRRGVVVLFAAAEEMGQAGSRAWLAGPGRELPVGWALNVDQVGRSRSRPRALQLFTRGPGIGLALRLRDLGRAACPGVRGWRLHLDDRLGKSDHGPFLAAGLPAVGLSEGPGYYPWEDQGAGDVAAKADPALLAAAARLVTATARDPGLPPPAGARPQAAPR
ncbi:MAG: M20/M25/M40 family metallo-hydrolase [Candidatus Krumholzibacteriota bacterium]|nr:M20/M25/M40 family metallo-hydrolase [Candidatus Krumholzibacteriota bacterium]